MSYRGTFSLLCLATMLWAYLAWLAPTSIESTQTTQGQALLPKPKEAITTISLQTKEGAITLTRAAETWRVTAPTPDLADDFQVEALLAQLEYARAARTLTSIEPGFGLQTPTATLSLTFDDRAALVLKIGADAVGGQLFYALRQDNTALLLPRALKEALTQDPARLRAQRALPFSRSQLTGITLSDGAITASFEAQNELWQVTSPLSTASARASRSRLDPSYQEALLRALEGLQVKRFDDQATPPPGDSKKISITTQKGSDAGISLELFGPITKDAEKLFFAKRGAAGFWVDAALVQPIFERPAELRDRRLFATTKKIISFTLSAGSDEVTLSIGEKGWQGIDDLDAREVERFLEDLQRLTVLGFPEADSALPAPCQQGPSRSGSASPTGSFCLPPSSAGSMPSSIPASTEVLPTLRVTLADKTTATLTVGPSAQPGVRWVQRDEEWVLADEGLTLLLSPDPLRFHSKRLLQAKVSAATSLSMRGPTGETRLEKRGDLWWVTAPIEAPADARTVEGLLLYFEELTAARLLDPSRVTQDTGLAKPRYQTTLTISPTEQYTLSLGDDAGPNEIYASLHGDKEPASEALAFTLRHVITLALDAQWVELRPFVALHLEKISGLSIHSGAAAMVLTQTDVEWRGADNVAYPNDKVRSYLEGVADITADAVMTPDEASLTRYQMATPQLTGELRGSAQLVSFSLGGVADDQKRLALRLGQHGPLYLISEEEASYLQLR